MWVPIEKVDSYKVYDVWYWYKLVNIL